MLEEIKALLPLINQGGAALAVFFLLALILLYRKNSRLEEKNDALNKQLHEQSEAHAAKQELMVEKYARVVVESTESDNKMAEAMRSLGHLTREHTSAVQKMEGVVLGTSARGRS